MVSLAADDVAILAEGIEEFGQYGEVPLQKGFSPACFVVDDAPVLVANIGLVADHVGAVLRRPVLYATVDKRLRGIARKAKKTTEFEVFVLLDRP